MKIQAVLFDMNGVIVDDEALHFAAFREVLGRRGLDLTRDGYLAYFAGKTDRKGFGDFFAAVDAGEAELGPLMNEKAGAYQELAAESLEPYPGAVELIRHLKGRGVPLALVTGSLRAEAEAVLAAFGIEDVFSALVTADDITNGKPDPEGFLAAARVLGAAPEVCLVIEDAPSGVAAAKAAGMRCAAVLSTHSREDLAGADAYLTQLSAESLDELLSA